MNKHRYQAKGLQQVDWEKLAEAAAATALQWMSPKRTSTVRF